MSDWKPVQYRAGELVALIVILTVIMRLIEWADLSPRSALYVGILVPFMHEAVGRAFVRLWKRAEDRRAKEVAR